MATQDRRRSRSRSPSAYLRKKGLSLKSLLSGEKRPKTSKKKKSTTPSVSTSDKSVSSKTTAVANVSAKDKFSSLPSDDSKSKATRKSAVSNTALSCDDDESTMSYSVVLYGGQNKTNSSCADGNTKRLGSVTEDEAVASEFDDDDAENISAAPSQECYSKTDQSVITTVRSEETVQIILLLMGVQTRRFELLQLEFDPSKAIVQDILAQIPKAAAEDTLRNQHYKGICSLDGIEMSEKTQLKNFVKANNEVKIAIPTDMTGFDCAKHATPIFNNVKVRTMLEQAPVPLDCLPVLKESANVRSVGPVPKVEEFKPTLGNKIPRSDLKAVVIEKAPPSKKTGIIIFMFVFLFSFLVGVVAILQFVVTQPLTPGTNMKPGQFRRKCGLMSWKHMEKYITCSEMEAEFDADNILNVYYMETMLGEKLLLYRIIPENTDLMTDEGLEYGKDGSLRIGGKHVIVEVPTVSEDSIDLSPWPFTYKIQLHGKKRRMGMTHWRTTS